MTALALTRSTRSNGRPFEELGSKRGRYTAHRKDYVQRFYELVRVWRAETAYSSSLKEMFDHHAFREIVRMGKLAVPLIIGELRRQPDMLMGALARITGENPVTDDDRGDVYAMAVAWIEWFNRKGR